MFNGFTSHTVVLVHAEGQILKSYNIIMTQLLQPSSGEYGIPTQGGSGLLDRTEFPDGTVVFEKRYAENSP